MEAIRTYLKNPKMEIMNGPAIPLLVTYPKTVKSKQNSTYFTVFIMPALFIIDWALKLPNFLLIDIHTMEYYVVTRKDEI